MDHPSKIWYWRSGRWVFIVKNPTEPEPWLTRQLAMKTAMCPELVALCPELVEGHMALFDH